MKRILFITLLLTTVVVTAQKKIIAFSSFKNLSNVDHTKVKAIESKVIEAFSKTNRFDIVDRTSFSDIKAEKELQKTEDFMDGKVVDQSSFQGAEELITGTVNNITYTKHVTDKGAVSYSAKIFFTLKVIDVATGKVLASEMIKSKQSFGGSLLMASFGGSSTTEQAFNNALNGMQKSIDKFVSKYFPITTNIIEITDASGGKAKKVLLNTGTINGSKKGQQFYVYEIKKLKVGDKEIERKVKLGRLKISEVQGEEISEAKVYKGGKEIFEKFKANANLECYSKN